MKINKIISILMAFIMVLSFSIEIDAQSITSDSFTVDDTTGWACLSGSPHMGTKVTSYKYEDISQKHSYSYVVESGIAMWENAIDVTYDQENGLGTIAVSSSTTYEITAGATRDTFYSDTGHIETWTLTIYEEYFDLTHYTSQICTIAHEIGHVYGLAHVENSDQIMYSASGVRDITTKDFAGMSVMTHEHTHSGSYSTYHDTSSPTHKNRCIDCLAFTVTTTYEYTDFMHTASCSHCLESTRDYCAYTSMHSGDMHYYDFNCYCGNTDTRSWPCSGNPCVLPYSVEPEYEIE